MKTIIKSILFTAALVLVMTGCQKVEDDINVSLKSSGILTTVNPWQSGTAASECEQAGGECTYGFKIDEWDEYSGMDGLFETPEGNPIEIINSTGKTFDWTSEYPVCKVIVKAGTGAYIYSYPGGAYHDEGLIGYKQKGISHVTFCYGEPNLVIAVKVIYWNGSDERQAVSFGTPAFPENLNWCGAWQLGYKPYPAPTNFALIAAGATTPIGEISVIGGDVTVTLNYSNTWTLVNTYLFKGTLYALQNQNLDSDDDCPIYENWIVNNTPLTNAQGFSYMIFDF
jgi:hypothetical protein